MKAANDNAPYFTVIGGVDGCRVLDGRQRCLAWGLSADQAATLRKALSQAQKGVG